MTLTNLTLRGKKNKGGNISTVLQFSYMFSIEFLSTSNTSQYLTCPQRKSKKKIFCVPCSAAPPPPCLILIRLLRESVFGLAYLYLFVCISIYACMHVCMRVCKNYIRVFMYIYVRVCDDKFAERFVRISVCYVRVSRIVGGTKKFSHCGNSGKWWQ